MYQHNQLNIAAKPLDLYCITCYVEKLYPLRTFVDKLANVAIECDKIKVIATALKKILEQVRGGLEKVEGCDNEIDERCEAEVIKPIRDMY